MTYAQRLHTEVCRYCMAEAVVLWGSRSYCGRCALQELGNLPAYDFLDILSRGAA